MGPTTSISTILPGAFLSFKTSSKRYTKNKKQTKQRLYVMHYIKYIFTTEALVWIVSRKIGHLSVGTQTYDNGKKFWIKQNDAFNLTWVIMSDVISLSGYIKAKEYEVILRTGAPHDAYTAFLSYSYITRWYCLCRHWETFNSETMIIRLKSNGFHHFFTQQMWTSLSFYGTSWRAECKVDFNLLHPSKLSFFSKR